MGKLQSKLLVSGDTNPGKALRQWLIFSVIAILVGIVITVGGNTAVGELTYFSRDLEVILAHGMLIWGLVLIVLGIVLPFLSVTVARKSRLNVYEDYIEGYAFHVVANKRQLMGFHETYDKISSVSTVKNSVSINLTSGNSIRCNVFNAEQVANAIRAHIT